MVIACMHVCQALLECAVTEDRTVYFIHLYIPSICTQYLSGILALSTFFLKLI